jgi:hypothetical protein
MGAFTSAGRSSVAIVRGSLRPKIKVRRNGDGGGSVRMAASMPISP